MKLNYLITLKINFISIAALFAGIALGMLLLFLYYNIFGLRRISKNEIEKSPEALNLTMNDFEPYVVEAKNKIKVKTKEKGKLEFKDICESIIQLATTIASKYYPNSKYPLAELTFEEIMEVDLYIANKIEEFLNNKILNMVKLGDKKLSSALKLFNKKEEVEKEKKGLFKQLQRGLNTIKNKSIKPVFDKALLMLIDKCVEIIGEETYQIYSKNVFEENETKEEILEIDDTFDSIYELEESKNNDLKNSSPKDNDKSSEDKEIEEMNSLICQTQSIKHDKKFFKKKKK